MIVVIIIKLIAHIDNHFIGTRDFNARLGIVKTHNPVGILIFGIIHRAVGVDLFCREDFFVVSTVVLVYISIPRSHCHGGCITLYNDYFFLWWLLLFFLDPHRFTARWIGIYIIPFLGETEERYGCQHNCQ